MLSYIISIFSSLEWKPLYTEAKVSVTESKRKKEKELRHKTLALASLYPALTRI